MPPRPLLLTFDDARADSWTGADGILEELGFNAVMFVDVGRVEDEDPEYLTWEELETVQESPRWELQLHSGEGHQQIQFGPGPDDFGPFYAYREEGEDLDGVARTGPFGHRVGPRHTRRARPFLRAARLRAAVRKLRPGRHQRSADPDELLPWLTERYPMIFTQDVNARAQAGSEQPLGRIQVTRETPGGDVGESLLSGEQ